MGPLYANVEHRSIWPIQCRAVASVRKIISNAKSWCSDALVHGHRLKKKSTNGRVNVFLDLLSSKLQQTVSLHHSWQSYQILLLRRKDSLFSVCSAYLVLLLSFYQEKLHTQVYSHSYKSDTGLLFFNWIGQKFSDDNLSNTLHSVTVIYSGSGVVNGDTSYSVKHHCWNQRISWEALQIW